MGASKKKKARCPNMNGWARGNSYTLFILIQHRRRSLTGKDEKFVLEKSKAPKYHLQVPLSTREHRFVPSEGDKTSSLPPSFGRSAVKG